MSQMGLSNESKAVSTPGVRTTDEEDGKELGADGRAEQPVVDVFSESDWAGCAKTRRSTSPSHVMLGGHLLAASATT